MVHHLEHLLFYGADMNARNASGNTPLHVCAVNNQVRNNLELDFSHCRAAGTRWYFTTNLEFCSKWKSPTKKWYLQESCARMLLFRGADKECLNYAGQTAYQVSPGVSSLADLAGLQIILIYNVRSPAKYSSEVPGWTAHNTISKSHRYFGLYLTLPTLRSHHTPIHSKFPKTSKYPNQTINSSHLLSWEMFSFQIRQGKKATCAILLTKLANSLHI